MNLLDEDLTAIAAKGSTIPRVPRRAAKNGAR